MIKPYPANRLENVPRRLRDHGRRCDGGGLREPGAAAADVAASGLDPLMRMARAPPKSSRSDRSCSARRAPTPIRCICPDGWPTSASTCASRASSATSASDLATLFRQALERADVVVLTGGLGPTDDDLTRDVVPRCWACRWTIDESIVAKIRARFERRGLVMPEVNRRQAQVPRGAIVLDNPNGTAPGPVHRSRRDARAPDRDPAARPAARAEADVRRACAAVRCASAPDSERVVSRRRCSSPGAASRTSSSWRSRSTRDGATRRRRSRRRSWPRWGRSSCT